MPGANLQAVSLRVTQHFFVEFATKSRSLKARLASSILYFPCLAYRAAFMICWLRQCMGGCVADTNLFNHLTKQFCTELYRNFNSFETIIYKTLNPISS